VTIARTVSRHCEAPRVESSDFDRSRAVRCSGLRRAGCAKPIWACADARRDSGLVLERIAANGERIIVVRRVAVIGPVD
jgi:hypothetical protein